MNIINELRLKRAKSRRAPMPRSAKPRASYAKPALPYDVPMPIDPMVAYAAELERLAKIRAANIARRRHKQLRREAPVQRTGTQEAARRVRQGAHLNQHPSVLARFANHPTQAEIKAEIAKAEGRTVGGRIKRVVKKLVA